MSGYRELIVWQKANKLIGRVYELTEQLPKGDLFGIGQQMRRATVSISSNIAEGYYKSTSDYLRFCRIAYGSAAELDSQIQALKEIKFIPSLNIHQTEVQTIEVLKLLNALTFSLKKKIDAMKGLPRKGS